MALLDSQKFEIFDILDLPNKDDTFAALGLMFSRGPTGETYDIKAVRDELNTRITALTADEETKFTETNGIFEEWDKVKNRHQLIRKDGGTEGVIFDAEEGRERVRQRTSRVLGMYVPKGGFMAEFDRLTSQRARGGSIVR